MHFRCEEAPTVTEVAGQTNDPARPRVRVVADAVYRLVEPHELDLRERPDLTIKKLLDDYPEKVRAEIARRNRAAQPA